MCDRSDQEGSDERCERRWKRLPMVENIWREGGGWGVLAIEILHQSVMEIRKEGDYE